MEKCANCSLASDFVVDKQSGDVICTNCGLVVESHMMESYEYCFNEQYSLTPKVIVNTATLLSLNEIEKICGRIRLPDTIIIEACRIFKIINSIKRKNNNSMYATVIYIACQTIGFPRSKNEVVNSISGVSLKDFSKFFKKCILELGDEQPKQHNNSKEFMIRFCSKLGLNNSEMKLCLDISDKCSTYEFLVSHTPVSLAASIIYYTSLQPKTQTQITLSDIVDVTNVANVTIRTICKCLKTNEHKLFD